MKKIALVAAWFFTLMIPSGFAQLKPPPPLEWLVISDQSPLQRGLISSEVAQGFRLSSGAYVNRVDLGFFVFSPPTPPPELTCSFSLAITDSLGPQGALGSIFLQREETLVIPSPGIVTFSEAFPTIFLPGGSFYLVVNISAGSGESPACILNRDNLTVWAVSNGSSEVGTVGQAFTSDLFSDWAPAPTTLAFDLAGPVLPPPTGGGIGQILRLVVEGPVTPPPGGPVQAELGFTDFSGNVLGPTSTVTVNPGQIQTLDLNVSQFGQRIEVLPFIAQVPNAAGAPSAPVQISSSVQILDALTGIGTILNPVPPPGASVPALGPQVLAGLQTMRVNVVAYPPDPCVGQISFTDKNGNPIGSTMPVNLSPGAVTSLDLNANTLGLRLGQSIEVQPIMAVTPPLAAAAVNSVCETSVEVFDHLTQRTESYQSSLASLPAVQSQQ